jgi:hypothetical protein
MKTPRPLALLCLAAALLPCSGFAQSPLQGKVSAQGSESYFQLYTGNGPVLTGAKSGALSKQSFFTSFGGSNVSYDGAVASGSYAATTGGPNAIWRDTITIYPADAALNGTSAILRTTYHATGSITAGWSNGAQGWAYYDIGLEGNFITSPSVGYKSDCPGCFQPLSNFNTFTYDRTFTFGSPLQTEVISTFYPNLDNQTNGSAQARADITVSSGGFVVLNSQGQPIDFTSSSGGGLGRGSNVVGGSSYAGFTLTNDTANGHAGTTVQLLDGNASANTMVDAVFTNAAPTGDVQLASDAVGISGMGTDPVVIQLDYPASAARAEAAPDLAASGFFRLGWLNPSTGRWTNAVNGNYVGQPRFVNRAYNPATDFKVGNYGHDAANRKVWAVVNHNSVFAVANVPDPLALVSAVSRKTHNGLGPFDIDLPLSGKVGVESRRSSPSNDHQIVLSFSGPLQSIGSVGVDAASGGSVTNAAISGNTVTVDLTGIGNQQIVTLNLTAVSNGTESINNSVSMGILQGDGSGDGTVNSGDAVGSRNRSGQSAAVATFRYDVNCDGTVNGGDATVVRSRSGTTIYPPM